MKLENKSIILISPQEWGILKLSKHHYAEELAKRNNAVYFLNPPNRIKKGVRKEMIKKNLFLINYATFFPYKLRFHWSFLYKLLMRMQVKHILRRICVEKPNIVWSFELNIFPNLDWFNAGIKIFHPVDPVTGINTINASKSADIVFSVSQTILDALGNSNKQKVFINHGLSGEFEKEAKMKLEKISHYSVSTPIKLGYVGNLMRRAINRKILEKLILNYSEIEFHFWGPYESIGNTLIAQEDDEILDFIERLKNTYSNVILHGSTPSEELAKAIQHMDVFLLTYQFIPGYSDCSNSHKILEYLSTGMPVVSNYISTYMDKDIIEMAPEGSDDDALLVLFAQCISDIKAQSGKTDQYESRIQYALENTYSKQLDKIEGELRQVANNV